MYSNAKLQRDALSGRLSWLADHSVIGVAANDVGRSLSLCGRQGVLFESPKAFVIASRSPESGDPQLETSSIRSGVGWSGTKAA